GRGAASPPLLPLHSRPRAPLPDGGDCRLLRRPAGAPGAVTALRRRWEWLLAGAAFAGALVLRLAQHQPGLLYPDGYQYLLMARGISEHLRPTTVLGPGGDLFVPNADAAAKPLFPALVAAVHGLDASWLGAARLVTAAAAAAVVVLTGLLVVRLG